MNFGQIKNIHFVGIGGIGMSGLAEILSTWGITVSGCDLKPSPTTERLAARGVSISTPHDPSHVPGADLVVVTSAVRSNPEIDRARELHIPVMKRAAMLGEVTRLKKSICVAGTHGKTTTSAMTAMLLAEAKLDPTLIIGGVLRNIDTNAQVGTGEYLVVEADEFDRSFLVLYPTIAIITNIEADHLDCYKDLDDIRASFAEFASRVPFNGLVIACVDDPNVTSLVSDLPKRTVRYGTSEAADLRAVNIRHREGGCSYTVMLEGKTLGDVELHIPGEHNVKNSLAAIAVALEAQIPFDVAAAALGKYSGVERRFQLMGNYRGALVVDDYAHHPTEIRATLLAARSSYPDRRIVALFQPHLFSRTRDFYREFAESLSVADVAFVSPIYPAREQPIQGVTAALITDAAMQGTGNVKLLDATNDEIARQVGALLNDRDLFITMGAGDVRSVAESLVGGAA